MGSFRAAARWMFSVSEPESTMKPPPWKLSRSLPPAAGSGLAGVSKMRTGTPAISPSRTVTPKRASRACPMPCCTASAKARISAALGRFCGGGAAAIASMAARA